MPYLRKEDRAAATRRWREKKRLGIPTRPRARVIPAPSQGASNVQRPSGSQQNVKTGHPARAFGNAFDVLSQALKPVASKAVKPVASVPMFTHPKVRSVHELPERAKQEAAAVGITLQGNNLGAPSVEVLERFKKKWML